MKRKFVTPSTIGTQDFFLNSTNQPKLEEKKVVSPLLTGHSNKIFQPSIKVPKSLLS